jgi:hypothetical protein
MGKQKNPSKRKRQRHAKVGLRVESKDVIVIDLERQSGEAPWRLQTVGDYHDIERQRTGQSSAYPYFPYMDLGGDTSLARAFERLFQGYAIAPDPTPTTRIRKEGGKNKLHKLLGISAKLVIELQKSGKRKKAGLLGYFLCLKRERDLLYDKLGDEVFSLKETQTVLGKLEINIQSAENILREAGIIDERGILIKSALRKKKDLTTLGRGPNAVRLKRCKRGEPRILLSQFIDRDTCTPG